MEPQPRYAAPKFAVAGLVCAAVVSPTLTAAGLPSAATETRQATTVDAASELAADGKTSDEVTLQVLDLEKRIERDEGELSSLVQRIAVTNSRIFRQQQVLTEAEAQLSDASTRYRARVVELYKGAFFEPITVLLGSVSVADLYQRVYLLSELADDDRRALEDARIAAASASYEAQLLEELKTELLSLQDLHYQRVTDLRVTRARQQQLIGQLADDGKRLVERRRTVTRKSRTQWRVSSIPIGTAVPLVKAVVEPHAEPFLVAQYQPRRYRAAGSRWTAVCSWYGNEFNGRPTASGQIFNERDLTCASRTLPFGTRIALSNGEKRLIVSVTDRGPFVKGRDLDLSKEAARQLGFSGVHSITAQLVEVVE